MIRVLHIFHEMANGGVEHFVMDNYRHMDRSRVQFDFLVSVEREGFFDEEIKALGGKIYHAYPLKKNPVRNYLDIARIVRENHYTIVHRHTGSAFGYWDLRAARHGGAKELILHSHNNQAGNRILHEVSNRVLCLPCHKFACSGEAGRWLFGEKASFQVVKNAIDCQRFSFCKEVRDTVRQELGIENKFVVGHIGRFETQKNHKRLLEIFAKLVEKNDDAVLICVGIGSLQEACINQAKQLGIWDKVKFLGTRSDIPQLMHAFDCFVMPSIYEGLPFVLVEAQANGLPCVASTNVPAESNIAKTIEFISLDEPDEYWADRILQHTVTEMPREEYGAVLKNLGYDIDTNAQKLCEYYESLA